MRNITIIVPLAPGRAVEGIESIKKQGGKIEVITEFGANTSRNRNRGAKKSKSELVAFINGHTILADNWLNAVDAFFKENPKVDIVGGPQMTGKDEGFFARISGIALGSFFGTASATARYVAKKANLNAGEFELTSANLICKKTVFRKVQFDEDIYPGEDPKFITDAKKAGFKVAYSPDIIVYNKRRSDFKSLIRQIFTYGEVRPQKEGFFETMHHPVFFMPSLFDIYLVSLPLLYAVSNMLFIPLYVYLLLDAVFSAYEGIRNRSLAAVFVLPFIFLGIHISYGLGFIYGYISRGKK